MKNKIIHQPISSLILLISSFFILTSCVSDESDGQTEQSMTKVSPVEGSVDSVSGSKTSYPNQTSFQLECDRVSQCKAIGISPSACGGYSRYLVYSTKTNKNSIRVQRINILNQQQSLNIKKKGVVGICVHIAEPILACQQNQCRIKSDTSDKALY